MGGENSGRIAGFAIRETVEDFGALTLPVGLVARSHQQAVSRYRWSLAGKEIASVTRTEDCLFRIETGRVADCWRRPRHRVSERKRVLLKELLLQRADPRYQG
jgi:hypothetical protein